MNSSKKWTSNEVKTLTTRFKDGVSDELIAQELGRTVNAVRQRRADLGFHLRQRKAHLNKRIKPAKGARFTSYERAPKKHTKWLWGMLEVTKY